MEHVGALQAPAPRPKRHSPSTPARQDFPAIIEKARTIGAGHLLVEQDDQYGRSPLDCLRTSHDNLVTMGFGDLF